MPDYALVLGSTYRMKLTASKDGSVWDLSSATVKLYLRKPDGTVLTKSATVSSPTAGVAHYDTLTTDLSVAGSWSRSWEVTDGSVVQESAPIFFVVIDSP